MEADCATWRNNWDSADITTETADDLNILPVLDQVLNSMSHPVTGKYWEKITDIFKKEIQEISK
jgi:hypothetical protein